MRNERRDLKRSETETHEFITTATLSQIAEGTESILLRSNELKEILDNINNDNLINTFVRFLILELTTPCRQEHSGDKVLAAQTLAMENAAAQTVGWANQNIIESLNSKDLAEWTLVDIFEYIYRRRALKRSDTRIPRDKPVRAEIQSARLPESISQIVESHSEESVRAFIDYLYAHRHETEILLDPSFSRLAYDLDEINRGATFIFRDSADCAPGHNKIKFKGKGKKLVENSYNWFHKS
jgi:hypothetical protein